MVKWSLLARSRATLAVSLAFLNISRSLSKGAVSIFFWVVVENGKIVLAGFAVNIEACPRRERNMVGYDFDVFTGQPDEILDHERIGINPEIVRMLRESHDIAKIAWYAAQRKSGFAGVPNDSRAFINALSYAYERSTNDRYRRRHPRSSP